MAKVLRRRIHTLLKLASFLMFCFGLAILVFGVMIRDALSNTEHFAAFGVNTCQYWAGIPTMLTGVILALTAYMPRRQFLKYVSLCCLFVTAVLALVAINRESTNFAIIDNVGMEDHYCNRNSTGLNQRDADDCEILKKARVWFWVLLPAADLTLVLCGFVSLLLFTDWMLYVVLKAPRYYQPLESINIHQIPLTDSHTGDQSAMPLQPVS